VSQASSFIICGTQLHIPLEREKHYIKHIPKDIVVSCIDFSKLFGMKVHNEIQEMHWFSFQIIVLVHITYLHNLDYDLVIQNFKIPKEVHYYASNEMDHDTLSVQHAFKLHWEFFKSKGYQPRMHVVWFEKCYGQFKSAQAWYFLGRYHNHTMCE
jgi:hypothetical protein